MNQSTLKAFAQTARRELRKQIELRLDFVLRTDSAELRQHAGQVKALREALEKEGREVLVERVAYTWFNRLAALRFMDANGYHPFGARVVTAASPQETLPEILQQSRAGILDPEMRTQLDTAETFDGVLSGAIPTGSREGSAYRMLLVAACHYYHRLMPFLFEKLGDATELLLPEDLLTEQSVVHPFRTELADDDCRDVEVIGWLYQFYISEKKAEVDARKGAVPTEDIPAVTQLFTPHWIVRYLVENSLGRLWLQNRPSSRLREKMPYYIESEAEADHLKIAKPEEIKLLDPAGGSGHMLTYAYDLLYAIYEEEGYDAPEIPGLILKYNLHGIDICDRAAALAAFALVMKARSSDNRFFRRFISPQVIALQDVRFEEGELSGCFRALGVQPSALHSDFNRLLHQFEEAKNFGSLIQPCLSEAEIRAVRSQISNQQSAMDTGDLMVTATHEKVLCLLKQAEALTQRYHVVVANPPYMGNRDMNERLAVFAREKFPDSKLDLCTLFMSRAPSLLVESGYLGLINMQSWMFLSSFQAMRRRFIRDYRFISMLHLGAHAFDSLQGEVVQTAAFVLCVANPDTLKTWFLRLTDGQSEATKEAAALHAIATQDAGILFKAAPTEFFDLPGAQFAYALSSAQRHCFSKPSVEQITEAEGQNKTADNGKYLRLFWEVRAPTVGTEKKWRLYAKGGTYRKWHGNIQYVIDWSDTARAHYRKDSRCRIVGPTFLNRIAATWTDISSPGTSFRFLPADATFDMAGPTIFPKQDSQLPFLLGMFNSRPVAEFLPVLNPTLHVQLNDVRSLPTPEAVDKSLVGKLVDECCALARADWDNFEPSWDFRDQPLLRPGLKDATLEASWQAWEAQSTAATRRMQELETENNRLFIAAYGLDGELQPDVPEEQVTLARADVRRDVAAFLSYAVGCMMGRYSLDQPGLILANAGATEHDYLAKIPPPTFAPDADGIIPVLDGEWFADDVVSRFSEFLRTTFGKETLTQNLTFIEASLGKDLRKYFAKDFYKNHLSNERAYGYKKRPIYWMVSSPEGSFQALIYLHRYTRDTVNTLLNDYVRQFIHKLEARHQELTAVTLNESSRPAERTKATKELGKIDKMLKELRAWERDVVLPFAQQRIELDLDDGVKVNYLKFPGLLATIPGLEKKEEE